MSNPAAAAAAIVHDPCLIGGEHTVGSLSVPGSGPERRAEAIVTTPPGNRRLMITGTGAVSPIGVGVPAFTEALRTGRSGVRPLAFSHPKVKSTVSAAVPGDVFDPRRAMDDADIARLPRLVPMALAACREALSSAGLPEFFGESELARARRIGLILGTGAGGIDFTLDQARDGYGSGPEGDDGGRISLWTITNATHGNLAGELSIRLGLRGPSWCVSTGCASSHDAVGTAMLALRGDESTEHGLDAFVVVGADAHVRWETLHGMELLRVISTRDLAAAGEDPETASRPFDATRDGFVLGEGAWAVVIERVGSVVRREAESRVRGAVLGYGATCDAYHRTRPDPDMHESARAMRLAMADAGLDPGSIELIHYHGTGTRLNDACETAAVRRAFGEPLARRLRGTSVKSMIGHPQGACGLAALVATLAGLNDPEPFIPPTINLRTPDADCVLDYTPNAAARTPARTALINCLAFGAKNSALVIRAR